MEDVSTLRLNLLRAMYLLIAVGLGATIWPQIVSPPPDLLHMGSVVRAMLGALAVLSVFGLRYPLQMIPLLLFELAWKVVWVIAFGLGPFLDGSIEGPARETFFECLLGVVLVMLVLPWGYVVRRYVRAAGDRWRARPAA